MTEPDTSFAAAYREAERVKAEAEKARLRALEEAAREEWGAHIYDPTPDSASVPDPRLYEGTGVGTLYGFRRTEQFLPELGDWRIVPGSNRP